MYEHMLEPRQLDENWQDGANCLGVDPDLFFPERGASTREAKEVCRGCIVREQCLEFALQNGDVFAQSVTEKLLTYAIGRGLEYEDMPLVRSITHKAARDDYKFSSLLMGVVQSPAFTMNVKTPASTTAANTE